MNIIEVSGGVDGAAADLIAGTAPSVVEIRNGYGIGAGVIWRPNGLIVTNDHVATGDRVAVGFWDGQQLVGQVVARDQHNDLAVVVVPASGLTAARHRLHAVRPGELVVAVGHPFGERYSAGLGIIASTSARETGRELIQADVPIGPGSSGGPLLDANGLVIGISAMVGGGMALAVPARYAEALVQAAIVLAAA